MIRDARHIYGGTTPDEVRQTWRILLARINQDRYGRGLDRLDLVDDDRPLVAYVNHGRWVADCPECGGGIGAWVEMADAACLDCAHVYRITFPTVKRRKAGEALLDVRREPKHRNWRPDAEDVARLRTENELLEGVL